MAQASLLLDSDFLNQVKDLNALLIGYSGGLDSTVLLHALLTLKKSLYPSRFPKLIPIHINHNLSLNHATWEMHCQQFCQKFEIELVIKKITINQKKNIEEAARIERYTAFLELMKKDRALVLGHHLNDQAETVLLQLFRGAGIQGLSAIANARPFGPGILFRPLINHSRQSLENYAKSNQLEWVEDESNADINLSRNYIRHQILPLLKTRWPGILQNLSRTSSHCKEAQINLDYLAIKDLPHFSWQSKTLFLEKLDPNLPQARINNILRLWFRNNGIKPPSTHLMNQIQNNLILTRQDAVPQLNLGENIWIRRYRHTLYLILKPNVELSYPSSNVSAFSPLPKLIVWSSFPQSLALGEGLGCLEVKKEKQGLVVPSKSVIEVRFRQGGELIRLRGQTKCLKKLFQEWSIAPWLRGEVPLIFINDQLACVVGFATSDDFYQSHTIKPEPSLLAYQISHIQYLR